MLSRSVGTTTWPPTDRIWVLWVCPLTEARDTQRKRTWELEMQPQTRKPRKRP